MSANRLESPAVIGVTLTAVRRLADIVVIGAGQAGCTVVIELRKLGFEGSIVLIGDEGHAPYQRPPLSKAYLTGSTTKDAMTLLSVAQMSDMKIDFIADEPVISIDRSSQTLHLRSGQKITYVQLAITTGGRNRSLSIQGIEAPNVLTLRTTTDADRLRSFLFPGGKIVVIGGGFIGLETAVAARKAGMQVTVLERQTHVLSRVTVPEVSQFFDRIHREAGVDVRTSVQVTQIVHDREQSEIVLNDGTQLFADCILVGVGMMPNIELAQASAIDCDNGICVDEYARTSDPKIVAAGDCTNHPSAYSGERLRLESVQNAVDQSRIAASTLMGLKQPYRVIPWFWSEQYDVKFQAAGLSAGHDEYIVRGELQSRSFSVCYLKAGRLIAVDSANRIQDHMQARKLIAVHAMIDKARIADTTQKLSECIL